MPRCFVLLLTLCAGLAGVPCGTARAGYHYGALLRDGTWIAGAELVGGDPWEDSVRLAGRLLFASGNPVRVLCDELKRVEPAEDFLRLANGDVLPGRVRRFLPADAEQGLPARLVVVPDPPLRGAGEEGLAVRADRVLSVVRGGSPGPASPPGTIRFTDGRSVAARAVRFSEKGVRALGDDGIVTGTFDEIVEIAMPEVDVIGAVLDDARWPPLDDAGRIVQLRTVGGAALTYRRAMTHVAEKLPGGGKKVRSRQADQLVRYLFVRPSWSVGAVMVPAESVRCLSFREPDEVPLSALPAETVRERRGLHYWPWRRDRSVTGAQLRSGRITAAWGLGTHSHSEIAFELPPGAKSFHTLVGVDAAVGQGGCVRVGAYRDRVGGEPLFVSRTLSGADEPESVGPLDVGGAKTLILVTAMAHDGRPAGADPFDIRDQVCWLMPTVTVDPPAADRDAFFGRFGRGLQPWALPEGSTGRWSLSARWDEHYRRWLPVIGVAEPEGLTLTRTLPNVSYANDLFEVNVAPAHALPEGRIELAADGEPLRPVVREYVSQKFEQYLVRPRPHLERLAPFDEGLLIRWDLSPFRGKSIRLELCIAPNRAAPEVVWREGRLRSAIGNLPEGGWPLEPDVPLTSLEPLETEAPGLHVEPRAGGLPIGKSRQEPLVFLGQPFNDGWGMRSGSAMTFPVEPAHRRFVAVVGCSQNKAGPFHVLLDGHEAWTGPIMDQETPAVQIDVAIAPGTKRLTIRADRDGGSVGYAAFASAGFITE